VRANSKKNQSKSKLEHFIETDPMMNNLLELFNRLDLDKTGGIDFNEAKKGLFDAGYQMSDEEVEHIWRVIDVGHR
jgi:Ca2+-binding EF-hand superfamily protein